VKTSKQFHAKAPSRKGSPRREVANARNIVTHYIKMWPQAVFDIFDEDEKLLAKRFPILQKQGVYVLFRDDVPYYVGQARTRNLFDRLHDYANKSTDKYYSFWNFFSALFAQTKDKSTRLKPS
jgi:hypothetical protein